MRFMEREACLLQGGLFVLGKSSQVDPGQAFLSLWPIFVGQFEARRTTSSRMLLLALIMPHDSRHSSTIIRASAPSLHLCHYCQVSEDHFTG